MTSEISSFPAPIQARLAASGMRRTLLTRAVVGYFLAHPSDDLSHSQTMGAMEKRGLKTDRVTLYRLLDRLAACGVLVRHTHSQERVWRYRLVLAETNKTVLEFECNDCQEHFALDTLVSADGLALAGFFSELIDKGHRDLSVRGICSSCSTASCASATTPKSP